MKRIVSGFVLVLILLVGMFFSCSSTPVVQGEIVAKDNESLIVVLQTLLHPYIANPIEVLINNKVVGSLKAGQELQYAVPNGQNTIQVRLGGLAVAEMSFEAYFQHVTFTAMFEGGYKQINLEKTRETVLPGRERQYADRNPGTGIEGALARAAEEVSGNFTARSGIAIVYIEAEDKSQTDFIAGELEHLLRRQGFVIIDRSDLDKIRAEQQFGLSGEVDDSTAARIGHIAGASVVITGRVDGEGDLRRLRLRALDTSTGKVVGTASERL
jgi:hypothetical protein